MGGQGALGAADRKALGTDSWFSRDAEPGTLGLRDPGPEQEREDTAPTRALHWLAGLGSPPPSSAQQHTEPSPPALRGKEEKFNTNEIDRRGERVQMVTRNDQLRGMISLHFQRRTLGYYRTNYSNG